MPCETASHLFPSVVQPLDRLILPSIATTKDGTLRNDELRSLLMKSRFVMLFAVAILLAVGSPVASQGAGALASYVTEVASNLMHQDTAVFEGYSIVAMDTNLGGTTQHIEINADIEGEYIFADGDFAAWYTVLDQVFAMDVPGAGQMAFDLTVESLMAEATLYERYTSNSPLFASAFPSVWTVVDDAAGTPEAGPMGDPTAMMPGIDITKLPYIIGEQTVAEATELESEVIDGRTMRVFKVDLDMDAVSNQFSAWMSGMPNDDLSEEDAALVEDMMPGLFSEMKMDWTVWIDTTTDLPYRSAGSMVGPLTVNQPGMGGQGMAAVMDLTLEFDMTFTAFNEPVTIDPPELGM